MKQTFTFSISEATGKDSRKEFGGEVNITDLPSIVPTRDATKWDRKKWDVAQPDRKRDVPVVYGGEVTEAQQENPNRLENSLEFTIKIFATIFAIGFLLTLGSDIYRGNLDFKTYLLAVGSFVLGTFVKPVLELIGKSKKTKSKASPKERKR